MTQQVSGPSEEEVVQKQLVQAVATPVVPVSSISIVSLLTVVSLLLVLFTGLFLNSALQLLRQSAPSHVAPVRQHTAQNQGQDSDAPLTVAGRAAPAPPTLPGGRYVIYEQQNGLYAIPATGGPPQLIATPGYVYNRATPPIVTPAGQLLYSGDGLWLTDIYNGFSQQIATLDPGQIITSLSLSGDGTKVAWSSEPSDGNGDATIHEGPLLQSRVIYQHAASDCPCFRVFSFYNSAERASDSALLLADDRGDHRAVRYGLWMLDLQQAAINDPGSKDIQPQLQQFMDEDTQQGPLAMAPYTNTLLYSSFEGVMQQPSDDSVPQEIATLNYANSLVMTTLSGKIPAMRAQLTILSEQHALNNQAQYHWVTTPRFTPDGHTLLYVEFTSDAQAPFDRHSALYTVQVSGSGSSLRTGRPQLLATSNDRFVELGSWLNGHMITLYSDGTIYALDITTGAVATIVQTKVYAHPIAVIGQGQE